MTALTLGFMPLTDCAPLVVAQAKGFFDKEGLAVSLQREASWATLRDKLAVGVVDGAHLLAPLALAMSLGVGSDRTPVIAPFALNVGGAAMTLSTRLAAAVRDGGARGLATLIARRRAQQSSPLTFATVFPYSIHNYLLRDWLAQARIKPDEDVRLTVVPPARSAELLADGVIEGFCAGQPWSEVAVRSGAGRIVMRASEFAPEAPDKVFATTTAWAQAHPNQLQALLRALLQACAWIDAPANAGELAALLARPEYVGVDAEIIAVGLGDIRFYRDGANRPEPAHARWLLEQMTRWEQVESTAETVALAAGVYRPDLFDEAQAAVRSR